MRYLEPGERVRLETRPHGIALAAPLARAGVLALAGGLIVALGAPDAAPLGVLGALALGLAAALALVAVARWDRTRIVLTSEKLLVLYGLLKRKGATVELGHSGPLEVEQTLLGHLLGYGTVVVGDLEIPFVPEAAWLLAVPRTT